MADKEGQDQGTNTDKEFHKELLGEDKLPKKIRDAIVKDSGKERLAKVLVQN